MGHVHSVLSAVMMAMPIIKGLFYKACFCRTEGPTSTFLLGDPCSQLNERLFQKQFDTKWKKGFHRWVEWANISEKWHKCYSIFLLLSVAVIFPRSLWCCVSVDSLGLLSLLVPSKLRLLQTSRETETNIPTGRCFNQLQKSKQKLQWTTMKSGSHL